MQRLSLALLLATVQSAKADCNLNNVQVDSCDYNPIKTATGCSDAELAIYDIQSKCQTAQPQALPWSDVTKRGYQFDKEFFNGGSIFNTEYESDLTSLGEDFERLKVIRDNLLTSRTIEWPGYIRNFETTGSGSCTSGFAMCCWVADRSPEGSGSCNGVACQDEDPSNNTDVCHLNMGGDAKRASHVQDGDAFFPGDSEGPVSCNGFQFGGPDEEWSGNMLFEVAMSGGLLGNGYVRNIPGAPMCACVEQMPHVSEAACTDYEVIGTESYTVNLESDDLKISANNDQQIQFGNCDGKSFSEMYPQVSQVSGSTCDDENYANSLGYKASAATWTPVAGKRALHEPSMEDDEFRQIWSKSPNQILRRRCQDCNNSHKDIFYKRYDENGLPDDIDLLWVVKNHWFEDPHNYFKVDFNLFSTYEEALADTNPWNFCNFDDPMIGFPRECGPNGKVHNQWNAFIPKDGHHHGQKNVAFYVEN